MGGDTHSPAEELREHVLVCGLGHVGYRCVELLDRMGERGVAISRHPNDQWMFPQECGFRVLVGDARNEQLLRRASVENAKAVLVVTDSDLTNVSIALDVRRLNPRAAVVVRMFDLELAGELQKSLQVHRILSASALAAPRFVAAAIAREAHFAFEIDAHPCVLAEHEVKVGSEDANLTVAEWRRRHHEVVLAVRRGERIVTQADGSEGLRDGDAITAVGFARVQRASDRLLAGPMDAGRRLRRLGALCRDAWRDTPAGARGALGLLAAVVCLSVVVFQLALGISTVDALYFVVTTITTVGYGDYNLMNASAGMKLYGVFLMLSGAALMATLFGIVADLLLSKRLRDLVGRSHAGRRGHIVIAGLGNIGFRLVCELAHRGESVVAIEQNRDNPYLAAARELGGVVLGNARTAGVLGKAGLQGAATVMAVTDDDLVNLGIAMAVRRARPDCRVVLRLFDSQLADRARETLDLDAVLSVSSVAAPVIVGSVLCPGVVHGLLMRDGLLLLLLRTYGQVVPGDGGGQDVPVFVKRATATEYALCNGADSFGPGDQVILARWLALAKARCGR